MRRFGEPLAVMLDIWGHRLIVPTIVDLDDVARRCAESWVTPDPEGVLLRNGALQFDWWRGAVPRAAVMTEPAAVILDCSTGSALPTHRPAWNSRGRRPSLRRSPS